MILHKHVKKLIFNYCPGLAGSFPYFGTRVYFPRRSRIFEMVCEQGIYEGENMKIIKALIKAGTFYFDVGANIGLTAVPVLSDCTDCHVVSFEASPHILPFLERTAHESPYSARWRIISKALGERVGETDFFISPVELSMYDGLRDTKRGAETRRVTIPMTTLDDEWKALGRPPVSVIKIDIEGAELRAIQGAMDCIEHEQPYLLLEWNAINLGAYDYDVEEILRLAERVEYQVFSLPEIVHIDSLIVLRLHMLRTDSFLLIPNREVFSRQHAERLSALTNKVFNSY